MFSPRVRTNLRTDDRILVIAPIEGVKTKNSTGLVDTKLFTGGNKLHAIKDPQSYIWYMRYENGVLPTPLKQRFTSFSNLLKFARIYFMKRGLEITRVEE